MFLSNCQRDNEVPLSLPAKEAQILELHSGLSTGGLADDGLKDVGTQERFYMSISECGKTDVPPSTRPTMVAVLTLVAAEHQE